MHQHGQDEHAGSTYPCNKTDNARVYSYREAENILKLIICLTPPPLDPLSPGALRKASLVLRGYHAPTSVRFKVIDLLETPKKTLIAYLGDSLASNPAPPRKAYMHYYKKGNFTLGEVESDTEHPDIQGPADMDEIELILDTCSKHPAVLAEIAKLILPEGLVSPTG